MDVFTVRDLREHTGTLIHDAEAGKLSLVTKRGHPVFLAVPFSEDLLMQGLALALAIHLFKEGVLTMENAAKIANHSMEAFIEKLGLFGIPAVTYSREEIAQELKDLE